MPRPNPLIINKIPIKIIKKGIAFCIYILTFRLRKFPSKIKMNIKGIVPKPKKAIYKVVCPISAIANALNKAI